MKKIILRTVGYGGYPWGMKKKAIAEKLIEETGDFLLIDVRSKPRGRVAKEDFDYEKQYYHIQFFGNPEYTKFFEKGYAVIKQLIQEGHDKFLLMCAEKDPNKCHRSEIKEMLKIRLISDGFAVGDEGDVSGIELKGVQMTFTSPVG